MKKMEIILTNKGRILFSMATDDKYLCAYDLDRSEIPESLSEFVEMFEQIEKEIKERESE